jgi:hypothetical protein
MRRTSNGSFRKPIQLVMGLKHWGTGDTQKFCPHRKRNGLKKGAMKSDHCRMDRAMEERRKQTPKEGMGMLPIRLFGTNNLKEGAMVHAPVAGQQAVNRTVQGVRFPMEITLVTRQQ